jgi:hypothetical protein
MRCRRPPILSSLVAAAAVTLLAAGCGGGSSTTAATTPQSGALAYSDCLRSHGVPNFPDPNSSGGNSKQAIVSALQAVGKSKAQAAQTACMHLNGGGPGTGQSAVHSHANTAAMLAFARCIRSHGFPNFPDPTSGGQLTREMLASAGIDPHQPAVLQAGDACVSVTHGAITTAIVARFVAGS